MLRLCFPFQWNKKSDHCLKITLAHPRDVGALRHICSALSSVTSWCHINQHRSPSININQHQSESISIIQNQSAQININQWQCANQKKIWISEGHYKRSCLKWTSKGRGYSSKMWNFSLVLSHIGIKVGNIARGEPSQAITPFHYFNLYH